MRILDITGYTIIVFFIIKCLWFFYFWISEMRIKKLMLLLGNRISLCLNEIHLHIIYH